MKEYNEPSENYIKKMFGSIAKTYDLTNDALSLGIHRIWKTKTVELASKSISSNALDCATGTGDLAFKLKKKNPGAIIYGLDFTKEMIDIAVNRSGEQNIPVKFLQGDILNLPFENGFFDAVTIGFGIRNVENLEKGISEMARVIKPGGRLVILEFGQPSGLLKYPYKLYSDYIIPGIGKIISRSGDAYSYLNKSTSKFPAGREFVKIMNKSASLKSIKILPLQSGIAYIYEAVKKA